MSRIRLASTVATGACVLAAPLIAQSALATSEVQIYGTMMPFLDSISTKGATLPGPAPSDGGASLVPADAYTGVNLPSRLRATSGTSHIGFRGSLQLAPDVKLIWQIESAVSPDGDAPNSWTNRNSRLGVTGSWGTAFIGSWDTPYKYPLLLIGPTRGLNPFDDAITANPGFGVPVTTTQTGRANGKADAAFNRRQGNSIQYWSPKWSGFSTRVAYSVNEGKSVGSAKAPSISPSLYSLLLTYEKGPLVANYAYECHRDYFGLAPLGTSLNPQGTGSTTGSGGTLTNPSSTDEGHEFILHYTWLEHTKLSAVYERLSYDCSDSVPTNINHYQRDAWYFQIQQYMGAHKVWGALGEARPGASTRSDGQATTTQGLGGRQWSIGYCYSLNKNADVYASCYGMDNEPSASYGLFPVFGSGVAPGADTRGIGVGIIYVF